MGSFSKFAVTTLALIANSPNAVALDFNLAPIEFANRAACAELSQKPALSAFLFIDSFNAGKAAYAEALVAKEDPQAKSAEAVRLFRLWTTHLVVEIGNKIIDGSLPL